jgi:hypothetical protein
MMTVKQLIEALEMIGDSSLPVHVHDLADGEHFAVELLDPTISDRVELNFNSNN